MHQISRAAQLRGMDALWVPSAFHLSSFSFYPSPLIPRPCAPVNTDKGVQSFETKRPSRGRKTRKKCIAMDILHETVDTNRFMHRHSIAGDTPFNACQDNGAEPSIEHLNYLTNERGRKFTFLSVFKWEMRKGWEDLITVFKDEFYSGCERYAICYCFQR